METSSLINGVVCITDYKKLAELSILARQNSYSPYSNFKVGACLLSKSGKYYLGCNIESASYSPSNCAERTAFFKAVSEGEREFHAIAVYGGFDGKDLGYCYPCGVCRQVMMEFCNPDEFQIVIVKSPEDYKIYTLNQILPFGFGPGDLSQRT